VENKKFTKRATLAILVVQVIWVTKESPQH